MTRKRALRIVLFAAASLCFLFAISVWLNLNDDLSSEFFAGDALDFARFIWLEINLMLIALAIGAVALLVALQDNLLSWRPRRRKDAEHVSTGKIAADKEMPHERDA